MAKPDYWAKLTLQPEPTIVTIPIKTVTAPKK
jgi:hypothetical protein